jgi:hypothetical protein
MTELIDLEKMMFAVLGKDGVEMLKEEWKEFSPFDQQTIDLHRRAMKQMKNGEIDLKELLEINKDFNFHTESFLKRAKIRETKDGQMVSFWDIFGGVTIPRPEYSAYQLAKLTMLIVAQKKIIKALMEKNGKDMSAQKITLKSR